MTKRLSLAEYFKKGNILVVDDMANMRRTIKNILRSLGIEENKVLQANDGDTALKILRNEKQEVIFVLLDWNMPNLPGLEVLRQMQEDEKLRNVPVLMITAENHEGQIAQAVEFEIKNYLIKPFLAETLKEKMLNIINPPEYQLLIKEGETLVNEGKYDEALASLQDLLKTKPESASIRILMGKAHEGKEEYEKAREFYEEALQKNHLYLRAHDTFAQFLIKTGDKEKALHSLEDAVKISPLNANRHISIGDIYLGNAGNTEKAEQAFAEAMKLRPDMAKEVAEVYLKNGMAVEAEKLFRAALKRRVNIHLYNRLGIALRQQKKWNEAVIEYAKALQVEPNNDTIYYNMGLAYLEGNKKKDAIERFKKAIQINPKFEDPKRMLEKLQASA